MADSLAIATDANGPTAARFTMRAMFSLTAIFAIGAVAFSWLMRQFPAEAQPRILAYWGGTALLLLLLVFILAWLRISAERQAGQRLWRFPLHSYLLPRAPRLATRMATGTHLAGGLFITALGTYVVAGPAGGNAILFVFYSVTFFGLGIMQLWWSQDVWLCEHGVVFRARFIAWQRLNNCYWNACSRNVLVFQGRMLPTFAIIIPDAERDSVETLVRARLGE